MPELSLILDTNVFLQYQGIESIPWTEIFSAKSVELLIIPPVSDELDRKKFNGTAREKDRAGSAISKLKHWLIDGETPHLPKGVSMTDADDIKSSVLEGLGADFAVPDSVIVAYAKHLIGSEGRQQIKIVTADMGLARRSKNAGISFFELPKEFLLKAEEDPLQKENLRLRNDLNRLLTKAPKLHLSFGGTTGLIRAKLTQIDELTDTEREFEMDNIKRKIPHVIPVEKESANFLPTLSQWEKYNEELDEFYQQFNKYLTSKREHEITLGRTAIFDIVLENSGLSPASDISIWMHFPDGFELLADMDFDKLPEPPQAPQKPQGIWEILRGSALGPEMNFNSLIGHHHIRSAEPRVLSELKIKPTNSFEVTRNATKLQHQQSLDVGRFFAVFDSAHGANSFEIEYRLVCNELPDVVTGILRVVIEN